MILPLYIARRFLRSFLLIAAVFLAILFLIDMVEQIRRFSAHDIGVTGAAKLALLSIGGSFYSILPLICVLAGIALFLGLSRSSEMVAIRASGRSGLRVLAAPALAAALIGAVAVAVLNPIIASTEKRYSAAVAVIQRSSNDAVSLGDSAVWLRQGINGPNGETGQMVIRAGRASPDATTLYDASFMIFDEVKGPVWRLESREARLEGNEWRLEEVKSWPLTDPNPEVTARVADTLSLPTDLTTDRIRDGFGRPDAIPVWDLPGFIAGLERAGFSATRHKVWLQMQLALPLTMAAMVAIAAVFTMRHMRGRRTGLLVLCAFAGGIGLYFLRNLAQVLGDNGDVPVDLAGWAPPLIGLLFSIGALLQLEDG